MASLMRQSGDDPGDLIELKPGVNRFGAGKDCDFIVDSSRVSEAHCDILVDQTGITVRDLDSLNGTFIDETPVAECRVRKGQTLRLGDLRLLVVDDTLRPTEKPASSGQVSSGPTYCAKHPDTEVSFHCPECRTLMCIHCVRVLKIHGGHGLCLCPDCSHECESLVAKDTRELNQMIDQLVMVRNAFAPRPHRHPRPAPSETV